MTRLSTGLMAACLGWASTTWAAGPAEPEKGPTVEEQTPAQAPAQQATPAAADPGAAPAAQAPAEANSAPVLQLPHVNAGVGNEYFFIRSDDDSFVLIPSGRFQYDFYAFQGGSNQPFNTFQPKRGRIEVMGTLFKHWDFMLGSEFTGAAPIITDAFINVNYTNWANVQLGQFDAPYTMENRTSDKWTDLQERTTVVRALAIPENKQVGAMVWGQPPGKWAYWSLGIFNGEGQGNFPNKDISFDVMGRAWFAPLGLADVKLLKNVWLGGSFWHGDRNWSEKNQIDRLAFKDSAGFTFMNTASGTVHLGDFGTINKWAVEANVPVGPVVVKAEYVNVNEGVRAIDSASAMALSTTQGHLAGTGLYLRASVFVWGDPLINGLAGMQNPPHLFGALKGPSLETALQLVAEYDHTKFGVSPNGAYTDSQAIKKFIGGYGVDTVGVGANFWATKHVRLTANFLYNFWQDNDAKPLITSTSSYEFMFRTALAL
jgi:phosphate-selective porin